MGKPTAQGREGVQHPAVRALERGHVHRAEEVTAFHSESSSHDPLCPRPICLARPSELMAQRPALSGRAQEQPNSGDVLFQESIQARI